MRASLIPKAELLPSQRPLYNAFAERIGKNYSAFKTMRDDGALLGPWGVWLQVPKTGEAIRQLIEAVEAMPGLSQITKQVVTLVTGAHFNAAYELYAHSAVGAIAGLSDAHLAALSAGEIPADLDADSVLAAQVAITLLKGGVLPGPLFEHAMDRLGRDGFNHVVFIVGQYCLVSVTLNAFDISPLHRGLKPWPAKFAES
jgi:4-carboxymuconolactone decarboxylase